MAIGLAAITRAAVEKGICDPALLPQVLDILKQIRPAHGGSLSAGDIQKAAEADKKRSGSVTKFVVPEAMGRCGRNPSRRLRLPDG